MKTEAELEARARELARELAMLIESWLADESGHDEEVGPKLDQVLREHPLQFNVPEVCAEPKTREQVLEAALRYYVTVGSGVTHGSGWTKEIAPGEVARRALLWRP